MKQFFFILSITILIQVSTAGSSEKVKRNDNFYESMKSLYSDAKEIVPTVESIVEGAFNALPETDDFDSYRESLEEFIDLVKDYNTKRVLCMDRTFEVCAKFNHIKQGYEDEDAPEQAAAVLKLFNENGYSDLKEQFEEWAKKYEKIAVNADNADALRSLPLALEVC